MPPQIPEVLKFDPFRIGFFPLILGRYPSFMSSNSLHAVLGDDDYLVRQRAKEIFDELCPEFPDDLSREIIDGRADRVDEVERILSEARSAGETLSLLVEENWSGSTKPIF